MNTSCRVTAVPGTVEDQTNVAVRLSNERDTLFVNSAAESSESLESETGSPMDTFFINRNDGKDSKEPTTESETPYSEATRRFPSLVGNSQCSIKGLRQHETIYRLQGSPTHPETDGTGTLELVS